MIGVSVLVGAPLLLLAAAVVPGIIGLTPVVVTSGSMEPVMSAGDIAVVKRVSGADVVVDDIITFRSGTHLVTHRVIGEEDTPDGRRLRTKGDNNETPDATLLPEGNVLAKYVYTVPKMGFVAAFANSGTGRTALIVLPLIALGLMMLGNRERKKKAQVGV